MTTGRAKFPITEWHRTLEEPLPNGGSSRSNKGHKETVSGAVGLAKAGERSSHDSLEDIQNREQEDPHDINEVPVETGALKEPVLLGRDITGERPDQSGNQ
jgi:hypothetical protein